METDGRVRSPVTLIVVGIVLSLLLATGLGIWQQQRNRALYAERFANLTDEFATLVKQRFHLYQYGLRGARGAVVAGGQRQISRETFSNYFATRDQIDEFPGARGVGYIERVPSADVEQFVSRARLDGFSTFAVRELSPNPEERFLIKYIFPLSGNEGATGLDIASESNRRNAAQEAARTGAAQLTAPITLVQASGEKNHGFLLLMPIYETGADLGTAEDRLAANYGWSYSPLVVSEVLNNLGPRRDEIAFSITDKGDGTLFFRSLGYDPEATGVNRNIEVFGRQWELRFHALPVFFNRIPTISPYLLAAAGGIGGLFLTFVIGNLRYNRDRARRDQEERDNFAYRVFDAAPQALFVVNELGKIVRASRYCEVLLGWGTDDLTGQQLVNVLPDVNQISHDQSGAATGRPEHDVGLLGPLQANKSDGAAIPVHVRHSPLNIGNRKLVVLSVTEITSDQDIDGRQ